MGAKNVGDIKEICDIVNPDMGILKIEAFIANEGLPIPDTDILIYKDIGEGIAPL